MRASIAAPMLVGGSASAFAHGTGAGQTETWSSDFWVLLPLAVVLAFYVSGLMRLWWRSGFGRGIRIPEAISFAVGWLVTFAALVTPLHSIGETLFVAHMVEHELLMTIAAPLLVLGQPQKAFVWAFAGSLRPRAGRLVQRISRAPPVSAVLQPGAATILHGVTFWIWHIPALFVAALAAPRLHWLQHVMFLATALIFWRALLRADAIRSGSSVFYLLLTALHTGFLGVLLVVASAPLYPGQTSAAVYWGLLPIEDQQLAGLVMWVPAGLIYALAGLAVAGLTIFRSGQSPLLVSDYHR